MNKTDDSKPHSISAHECQIGVFVVPEYRTLAAVEKYKNKLLEVTGAITDIATASGGPYIAFSTGDFLCDVHAYLSVTQIDVAMTLSKGDMVTVVGTCKGMGIMTIDLKECYID